MEVCCNPGPKVVVGIMRSKICSCKFYFAAERHHEAQKHPGGRGRGAIFSRAVHDALHVNGAPSRPPSLECGSELMI